jgi:hypothetical protein
MALVQPLMLGAILVDLTRLKRGGPSGNIPRAQVGAQGARTVQAIGGLGEKLAGFSNALLTKRSDQEAREFRDDQSFEYRREIQKFREDNLGLLKSDPKGYEAQLGEFLDTRQVEISEGAPHEKARKEFINRTNQIKGTSLVQGDTDISASARQENILTKTNNIGKMGNLIRSNPDPEYAEQVAGDMIFALEEDETLTPAETKEMQGKTLLNARQSYIGQAATSESVASIKEAEDLLESDNLIMRTASSAEVSKYKTQLNAAKERIRARTRSGLVQDARTAVNAYNTGAGNDEFTERVLKGMDDNRAAFKTGAEFNAIKTKLISSKVLHDVSETVAMIPPDKRPDLKTVVESELSGIHKGLRKDIAVDSLTAQAKVKLAEETNEAFAKPVKFMSERDPAIRETSTAALSGDPDAFGAFKSKMDAFYDEWNFPRSKRSYTSPSMKKVWGDGIKTAMARKDIDSANAIFDTMNSAAGSDIHSLMVDMRSSIPDSFAAIAEIKDPDLRKDTITNVVNGGEIKEGLTVWNSKQGDDKVSFTQIKNTLMSKDFYKALQVQGGDLNRGTPNALSIADVTAYGVAKRIQRGESLDDAVKAERLAFESQYSEVEDDNDNKVFHPRVINGQEINSDKVTKMMNNIRSGGDITDPVLFFEIALPEGVSKEAMNDSIRENGQWVLSHDKQGLELFVGSQMQTLLNKKGGVPFMSFEQIQNDQTMTVPNVWNTDKRKTREVVKGLFKR